MINISLEKSIGNRLPARVQKNVKPLLAGIDAVLSADDENSASQRIALITFAIRVASAVIAFMSQILLARWLGTFEYGVFVAVWVGVIILATIGGIGFPSALVRYIGEYRERGNPGAIWGIIRASLCVAFAFSTLLAGTGSLILYFNPELVTQYYVIPIFLAAICLPMLTSEGVMEGIARSFNWPKIAFLPTYIVRPLGLLIVMGGALLLGFPPNAETAMWAFIIATYGSGVLQFGLLVAKLNRKVSPAKPLYKMRTWLWVAMPIFLVEGFYMLMTSVDVLLVSLLTDPEKTAVYFASAKILALVHFVYFAVRSAVSHRYSAFHTAGDHSAFQEFVQKTVTWTFWPSLLMAILIAAMGRFLLLLFGSEFVSGDIVLWILAIGIVIRSSIGPAEALLVMSGQQTVCAMIYAVTLGINIVLNLSLIPVLGLPGAAVATSFALAFESAALHTMAKRTLGLHAFIIPQKSAPTQGIA